MMSECLHCGNVCSQAPVLSSVDGLLLSNSLRPPSPFASLHIIVISTAPYMYHHLFGLAWDQAFAYE